MRLSRSLLVAVVLAVVPVAGARASIIFQDNFNNNPGPLMSSQYDPSTGRLVNPTPQTAGDRWNINNSDPSVLTVGGGVLTIAGSAGHGFGKAVAPFDATGITQGITLSFDLAFLPNSNIFAYGGFGNGAGNGANFADYTGGPMFNWSNDTSSGTSATLYLGNGPFTNALHATLSRADTSSDYLAHVMIQVNPTSAINNVEYFVNGTDLGSTSYTGAIGGLWFKGDGMANGAGYTLDNLTVSVPEPVSAGVLLGGLPLIMRRRRALRA